MVEAAKQGKRPQEGASEAQRTPMTAAGRLAQKAAAINQDSATKSGAPSTFVVPDFSKLKPKPFKGKEQLKEILPKAGLVYSEKALLSEALCKPKLLPLKSATLLKLEKMEQDLA